MTPSLNCFKSRLNVFWKKNTRISLVPGATVPDQNQETSTRMHLQRLSSLFLVSRICELYVSYLYSRVTRESLANFAQSCKRAKPFVKHARSESDKRDLYNLNNLARKVCCKKMFQVKFSCPPDVNIYVKFDCIDYCLVPPSIHT